MSRRFNPASIVRRHFRTLHKEGSGKINSWEYALFSLIPLGIGALISNYYILENDTGKILITVFAVFAGLFLNLLAMIYNVFDRSFQKSNIINNYGDDRKNKLFLFQETIHNIAFGVLVSVLIVILSLGLVLFGTDNDLLTEILNYFIHTMLVVFIFTVLMVLKGLDNLINSEIKRKLVMFDEIKKAAKKKATTPKKKSSKK